MQIQQHIDANSIFSIFQSVYRPMHICEIALIRTQDDILLSLDNKSCMWNFPVVSQPISQQPLTEYRVALPM